MQNDCVFHPAQCVDSHGLIIHLSLAVVIEDKFFVYPVSHEEEHSSDQVQNWDSRTIKHHNINDNHHVRVFVVHKGVRARVHSFVIMLR